MTYGFRRVLVGCLVSLLTIASLAAALLYRTSTPHQFSVESPTAGISSDDIFPAEATVDLANVSFDRPNYRYSVIPRGAYTEAELRTAIETDPVVATHYKHLDQPQLRTEVVTRDRYVHVSYRKGNEIFWTKKRVLLRQGETIVTDGTTQVRARCGNCISEDPLLPTSKDEPEAVEFDRLVDAGPSPSVPSVPQAAFVQPVASSTTNPGVAAPGSVADGLAAPLGASRFGSGAPTPLAALERDTQAGSPTPSASPLPGSDTDGPPGLFPSEPLAPLVPPAELFPNSPYLPPVNDILPPGSPEEGTNAVPVPEPGTLLLVGSAMAELIRRRRSRKP